MGYRVRTGLCALLPDSCCSFKYSDSRASLEITHFSFLFVCLLLQRPEDEMFLKRLSSAYLVEKDPDAPLFYREEGNRKFQEKDYAGAAVLYSKVTRMQPHGCTRHALQKLESWYPIS